MEKFLHTSIQHVERSEKIMEVKYNFFFYLPT
jgi:hypothetical protein